MNTKIAIPNRASLPRRCLYTGLSGDDLHPIAWSYGKAGFRSTHSFTCFISSAAIERKNRAYRKWKLCVYLFPVACIGLFLLTAVIDRVAPMLSGILLASSLLGGLVGFGVAIYTLCFGKVVYVRARPALMGDGIVIVGAHESFKISSN